LVQASDYITREFETSGYEPTKQSYDVSRLPVSNIEATLAGTLRASEIIVLGAHYDTVSGCPGTNDNASGGTVLLELARRFASRRQPRTVRFVAFVNEEPPFFRTHRMAEDTPDELSVEKLAKLPDGLEHVLTVLCGSIGI